MDQERDIEWSIRELVYRNYEMNTTLKKTDMAVLLQKNYQEYRDSSLDELTQLADSILINLTKNGILTSAGQSDIDIMYRISAILDRYQCNECNQISYIGEKEDRKCFSCESMNLRERNVH